MAEYVIAPLGGHHARWLQLCLEADDHSVGVDSYLCRMLQAFQQEGDLYLTLDYHCLELHASLEHAGAHGWATPLVNYVRDMGQRLIPYLQPHVRHNRLPYEVFRIQAHAITLQRIDLFKRQVSMELRSQQ